MTRSRTTLLAALLGLIPAMVPLATPDPPTPDPFPWHTCKPVLAYINFGDEFEVRCDEPWTYRYVGTPPGEVAYSANRFSISAKNADHVAQAMATVHTALVTGKKVKIHLRFNSTENPKGCDASNCRSMIGIGVTD